jgi:hypothetical protein
MSECADAVFERASGGQQQQRGSVAATATAAPILRGAFGPLNSYLPSLAALGIDAPPATDELLQGDSIQLLLARLAHTKCYRTGVLLIDGQLRPWLSGGAASADLASDHQLHNWVRQYAPEALSFLHKRSSRRTLEDTITKFLGNEERVNEWRGVLKRALQHAANGQPGGGEGSGAAAVGGALMPPLPLPPDTVAHAASQPGGGEGSGAAPAASAHLLSDLFFVRSDPNVRS